MKHTDVAGGSGLIFTAWRFFLSGRKLKSRNKKKCVSLQWEYGRCNRELNQRPRAGQQKSKATTAATAAAVKAVGRPKSVSCRPIV